MIRYLAGNDSHACRRPQLRHLFAVFLFVIAASPLVLSQSALSFDNWLRTRMWRITTVEPSTSTADLDHLRPLFADARVIALGEPSHGNHEPLAFRNRLFQYLVEQRGFTAIALETGFAEAITIQDFVSGSGGSAANVVRDGFTYGFGQFDENVALVQWMRDYNANPTHRRKLAFYGISVSLGGPRTATPTPVPIERALAYLNRVDTETARHLEQQWQPWFDRLRTTNPEDFTPDDHDALTAAIDDLVALFERRRAPFVARTSSSDFDWAYRSVVVARDTDRMFRAMPPPERGRIPAAAWRQMNAGDEAMASTMQWIAGREAPGRVLVFAHNTHVQDEPLQGGVWSSFERPPEPMGMRLRQMFGDRLRVVGVAGAASAVGLPFSDPGRDSIDFTLARAGVPLFVIGWRAGGHSAVVAQWLSETRRLRSGATFELVAPGHAFDALMFIERLTPARAARAVE